jgi:hypothetical protein
MEVGYRFYLTTTFGAVMHRRKGLREDPYCSWLPPHPRRRVPLNIDCILPTTPALNADEMIIVLARAHSCASLPAIRTAVLLSSFALRRLPGLHYPPYPPLTPHFVPAGLETLSVSAFLLSARARLRQLSSCLYLVSLLCARFTLTGSACSRHHLPTCCEYLTKAVTDLYAYFPS